MPIRGRDRIQNARVESQRALRSSMGTLAAGEPNPTGVIDNLIRGTASEIAAVRSSSLSAVANANPMTATSEVLDRYGALFGVRRQVARSASSPDSQIVYTTAQRFGTNSNGMPFRIRNGTTIGSTSGGFAVHVDLDGLDYLELPPNESRITIPVTSTKINSGFSESIPAEVLTQWSPPASHIRTRNTRAINWVPGESTENFRYRIMLAAAARGASNEAAVSSVALSVPGVSRVRLQRFPMGLGSLGILVTGTGGVPGPTTLTRVRNAVESLGLPVALDIRGVRSVPLKITVSGNSESERSGAAQVFRQYIDSLEPGAPFSWTEFRTEAQRRGLELGLISIRVDGVVRPGTLVVPHRDQIFEPDLTNGGPVIVAVSSGSEA